MLNPFLISYRAELSKLKYSSREMGTNIQSEGGKFDNKINYEKSHAKIFRSVEELLEADYVNASKSDLRAILKRKNIW